MTEKTSLLFYVACGILNDAPDPNIGCVLSVPLHDANGTPLPEDQQEQTINDLTKAFATIDNDGRVLSPDLKSAEMTVMSKIDAVLECTLPTP